MAFDFGGKTSAPLEGAFRGQPKELWSGKPHSSIDKSRLDGRAAVHFKGIAGDAQADLKVHGGPDKAVSFYPAQHYAAWNKEIEHGSMRFSPGSFGENISSDVFDEKNVCIGDVFKLGSCRLQVTQGRTPCWKLNRHTGVKQMAALFLKTGRTGWYFRVLEEGVLYPDSELELVRRLNPDYSVHCVTMSRVSIEKNPEVYLEISQIPELSAGWKKSFSKKAESDVQKAPSIAWAEPPSIAESGMVQSYAG